MGPRVLVVDDHATFRAAARALLEAEGFQVVAEAGTASDAVEAARRLVPDVVLLDVRLPDVDGITLAGQLARLVPRPDVVLVSSRPARDYGERLRDAPVTGFLGKSDLSGDALRDLLAGHPRA